MKYALVSSKKLTPNNITASYILASKKLTLKEAQSIARGVCDQAFIEMVDVAVFRGADFNVYYDIGESLWYTDKYDTGDVYSPEALVRALKKDLCGLYNRPFKKGGLRNPDFLTEDEWDKLYRKNKLELLLTRKSGTMETPTRNEIHDIAKIWGWPPFKFSLSITTYEDTDTRYISSGQNNIGEVTPGSKPDMQDSFGEFLRDEELQLGNDATASFKFDCVLDFRKNRFTMKHEKVL
jgi:hypothetical protein